MAKRKAQSSQNSGGGGILLFVAMILFAAAVGYVAWRTYQQQHPIPESAQPTVAESSELISEDREVFGGLPQSRAEAGDDVTVKVLRNSAYTVGYSEMRKDPLWVAYRVFHNPNAYHLPRPTGNFISDQRTESHVKDSDYVRSGYDRGHMAPNAAIARDYGRDAQLETFLLTNVCPQAPALNEYVWERLEIKERAYADALEEVWVIDGPIFADLNGGKTNRLSSGIAVPSAFYKILIDEEGYKGGRPRIFSVIMPQDVRGTELPQQFLTNVREIENETHLDFMWKLDDATEAQLETHVWPIWPERKR